MKRLLLAGAAIAALGCATPAFAAELAYNEIGISGTSTPTCTLNSGASSRLANATFTAGSGTSTLAITTLASATDATLQHTAATLTFVGMCNYAHNIGIVSAKSGLQNATVANNPVAGSGNFIKKVGYTASYTWAGHSSGAGETLSFVNDVGTGTSATAVPTQGTIYAVAGANQGNLALSIDIPSSSTPVVAGTYSDTLAVVIAGSF